jgi:hypothetical protein
VLVEGSELWRRRSTRRSTRRRRRRRRREVDACSCKEVSFGSTAQSLYAM